MSGGRRAIPVDVVVVGSVRSRETIRGDGAHRGSRARAHRDALLLVSRASNHADAPVRPRDGERDRDASASMGGAQDESQIRSPSRQLGTSRAQRRAQARRPGARPRQKNTLQIKSDNQRRRSAIHRHGGAGDETVDDAPRGESRASRVCRRDAFRRRRRRRGRLARPPERPRVARRASRRRDFRGCDVIVPRVRA